jgi:hypothetical protein
VTQGSQARLGLSSGAAPQLAVASKHIFPTKGELS